MNRTSYNNSSLHSITRRIFIKTGSIIAMVFPFNEGSNAASRNEKTGITSGDSNVLYNADFIPPGASCKIAFVADHHYWSNHQKNWGEKQFRHTEERMLDLVETLNNEDPDISIHGGDLIDAGEWFSPPFDEYIRQLDFEKKFLDSLKHPKMTLIGNHDVPDAYYESESELEPWKQRFGQPYRFMDINGWRLVGLNCMIPNPGNRYGERALYGLDDAQMTWLASVLDEAARNSLRVLLFAHIPPTSYVNNEKLKRLVNAAGCVKTIMVGHTHRNKRSLFGDIPVLERIYNTASPLGYSMVYPYPDGRILVVQKSQHFPFIDYTSHITNSSRQGDENERYITMNGSTSLPINGLKVISKYTTATIENGHLTLNADRGKGVMFVDKPALDNVRLSFTAVSEGTYRMGAIAYANEDCTECIEAYLCGAEGSHGPFGDLYIDSVKNNSSETIAMSWFNISDGIAYRFILEARKLEVTLAIKNMPSITAHIKSPQSGKFGIFADKGKMIITDLKLEKLS